MVRKKTASDLRAKKAIVYIYIYVVCFLCTPQALPRYMRATLARIVSFSIVFFTSGANDFFTTAPTYLNLFELITTATSLRNKFTKCLKCD